MNGVYAPIFIGLGESYRELNGSYENAVKVGDVHSAIENLRRFFDQQFSQTDESGLTQHALLNLARLHYSLGEFQAAGSVSP